MSKIDIDTYLNLIIINAMFLLLIVFLQTTMGDTDVLDSTAYVESSDVLHDTMPAPPTQITTRDRPNDAGGGIIVFWKTSEDDGRGRGSVTEYRIFRRTEEESEFLLIGTAKPGDTSYADNNTRDGIPYYYQVKAFDGEQYSTAVVSERMG